MEVKNLEQLYTDTLRDLFNAENQITEALPKLVQATSSQKLEKAFRNHLKVTEKQIERLQAIFDDLGESPEGHECKAMQGLVEEGEEILEKVEKGPVLDAALIGAAQKVEHYEIASYGTARTFATMLGFREHASKLQATLDEEGEADKELTQIAEEFVNEQAAEADGQSKTDSRRSASKSRPAFKAKSDAKSKAKTPARSR
jgi:ferritin-like metal-binding protein YciE